MKTRVEKDTMGEVQVDDSKYWGAQTQRSKHNFKIGISLERMPKEIVYAFALLKKSCAIVNCDIQKLQNDKKEAICKAADEVIEGKLDEHFPLVIWQTGSGTQSNMNLNEVLANRGSEILNGNFRVKKTIHPNDDVNMGQSSNDTFPTAMRIAETKAIIDTLLPCLNEFHKSLKNKQKEFQDIIKIGRTHLQDATPLSLGQEFSGYVDMIDKNISQINESLKYIQELAIGGTAVGTGINTHPQFSQKVCKVLNEQTKNKYSFKSHPNKFHALTSHDGEVVLSGALKALAGNLLKIVNDIRFLGSGPRCGIGELDLPANEPGSSIMPGKVNPTQAEAVSMVCAQVIGNDTTIGFSASQGNFELNVYKPVIAYNVLQSIRLLSESMTSFKIHCLDGLKANTDNIDKNLHNSLMLVTALNPHIGYEKAAQIAKNAHQEGITLKESAISLGFLNESEFDKYIVPKDMISPK